MKIYLDNLTSKYYGWNMQNLKVVKAEIEEKIKALQQDLDGINNALKIQNKHSKSGSLDLARMGDEDTIPTAEEIEKAILSIDGNFKAKDVLKAIAKKFPKKRNPSPSAIAVALHKLYNEEKLDYVRERKGRTPAIYCKMGSKH